MNNISLWRRVMEELDFCKEYDLQYTAKDDKTVIYFYYNDPLDSTIWTISAPYFREHLKKFFDFTQEKQINSIQ